MNRPVLKPRITDRPTSLLVTAALLLAVGLVAGGCGGPAGGSEPDQAPAPRPVQVDEARRESVAGGLRLSGSLRSVYRARPGFLHPGYLAERRVALGEPVDAGAILAVLHNPALQPGVDAAQAAVSEAREQLEQLERDTRRLEELHQRRLVSDDELERTRARRNAARESLAGARARLAEAREQLAEASLKAPFAGTVMDVLAEPGDFVAAGQPILELGDPERLEVRLELPPGSAAALAPGSVLELEHAVRGTRRTARVREIGGATGGGTRPLIAELDDGAGDWLPGDPVHARIPETAADVLTVPLAALISPGGGQARVFRVTDGRAEAVSVTTGRLLNGRVEVTGPLAPGEVVVVAGQAALLDGEPVRALP